MLRSLIILFRPFRAVPFAAAPFALVLFVTLSACSHNSGTGGDDTSDSTSATRGYKTPVLTVPDSTAKGLNEKAASVMYVFPDSAIYYAGRAAEAAGKSGNEKEQTLAFGNLGRIYYIKGSYDSSLHYSTRSLELAEKANDLHSMALEYNNIGLVYLGHEQYDLALKEFLRSLDIAGASHDSVNLSAYLFNVGICYDHEKNYSKAIDYLTKARSVDKRTRVAVMSVNRLGETYLHINDPDRARSYYREVLADSTVKNDNWEKAFAYAGLAQAAYAQKQFDSAIDYAGESLRFANRISAKWDEERAARFLAESYAALHQYQKAYEYEVLDRSYEDSLYDESREEVVSYLKLKREEKQNLQWQTKSGEDKKIIQLRTGLLIVACLFVLLLIFIVLFMYRSYAGKHRLSERLASSNQLKDQLFSVISHDLRGPLTAMQQMLERIRSKNTPEEEREKLNTLFYRQVVQSNIMVDNLLQWANVQRSGSDLITKKELFNLTGVVEEVLLVYGFLALQKKITIQDELPPELSMTGDREQLKIVLQNLIGNAIKFTHSGGQILLFHRYQDKDLHIFVKDNGVGIPAEKLEILQKNSGPSHSSYGTASEKGTGIGLQMVKQFVERNNGKVSISSRVGEGTEIAICFPV